MRLCYQFAELFSKMPSAWSDTFSEKRSYQRKKVKLYSLLSLWFPYTLTKNIIFTTIWMICMIFTEARSLRKKCPNTGFFMVRIFPHWD